MMRAINPPPTTHTAPIAILRPVLDCEEGEGFCLWFMIFEMVYFVAQWKWLEFCVKPNFLKSASEASLPRQICAENKQFLWAKDRSFIYDIIEEAAPFW